MISKVLKKIIGPVNARVLASTFVSSDEKKMQQKRRTFYSQFLKKGDIYYDVGANYGNRIEPIKNLGLKIIAVEPQDNCINYLQKKYGDTITVIPYGLSNEEGTETMYISKSDVLSSFSKDWIDSTIESGRFSDDQYRWEDKREIKITTLDKVILEHGLPNFLKIDVEGFELKVLQGLNSKVALFTYKWYR